MKNINEIPDVPEIPQIGKRIRMKDNRANIFVRNKLNRLHKWYGPKFIIFDDSDALAVGKRIVLYPYINEIHIGDNVYKMDKETKDCVFYVFNAHRTIGQKRWEAIDFWQNVAVTTLFFALVYGTLAGCITHMSEKFDRENKEHEENQEKVIQDKVHSVNTLKTMYLNDNFRSIKK